MICNLLFVQLYQHFFNLNLDATLGTVISRRIFRFGARGLSVCPLNVRPKLVHSVSQSARSPCQVITEPAGACLAGAPQSEITPLELKPAGLEDADLHRLPHNQGLSFNTAKIHQKIPATRCHLKCHLFV